ncbi:unnamed protein product [Heterobilharzia americana]|nr:unnamed protein product [Heterobilharzia americana]
MNNLFFGEFREHSELPAVHRIIFNIHLLKVYFSKKRFLKRMYGLNRKLNVTFSKFEDAFTSKLSDKHFLTYEYTTVDSEKCVPISEAYKMLQEVPCDEQFLNARGAEVKFDLEKAGSISTSQLPQIMNLSNDGLPLKTKTKLTSSQAAQIPFLIRRPVVSKALVRIQIANINKFSYPWS